ncbi:MAG: hypothetical protein A2Z27_06455 [candidate division Zixibacteria bacterium RBG_16_50_21]|nr:MAG: hypothetical protein A2Z27_06455 [candidate division Zixibacteria bacterium RBG_16_50_21]
MQNTSTVYLGGKGVCGLADALESGEPLGAVQKPYNIPKKSERQVEIVGSRKLNNQHTPMSNAARKWPKSDIRKPYKQ